MTLSSEKQAKVNGFDVKGFGFAIEETLEKLKICIHRIDFLNISFSERYYDYIDDDWIPKEVSAGLISILNTTVEDLKDVRSEINDFENILYGKSKSSVAVKRSAK